MVYYRIDPELFGEKYAYATPYADCQNYDHNVKEAYCPLCGRAVGGSVWMGPYRLYVSSMKIPDVMYGVGFSMLISDRFKTAYESSTLHGVDSFQKYELFYRGKPIETDFFCPRIAYSSKKIEFAKAQNQNRIYDKSLPKCSLCRKSGNGRQDDGTRFYFDDIPEYDIFKIYEEPGKIYCSQKFLLFCQQSQFKNIVEYMREI